MRGENAVKQGWLETMKEGEILFRGTSCLNQGESVVGGAKLI